MPPMDPRNFGTLGRGPGNLQGRAELGAQLKAYQQEVAINAKVAASLKKVQLETLQQAKTTMKYVDALKEAKAAGERWTTASEAATEALRGTIKNTDKLGEAILRDTKFIQDFAAKNKISLEMAAKMYKEAKDKQNEMLDKGAQKWKGLVLKIGTAVSIGHVYNMRVKEIYGGQKLMAESTSLIGEEGKKAWEGLRDDIEGYRKAQREASDVAARWGISVEDARQQMDKLGPAIKKSGFKDLGYHVKSTADELNKFAFVSGGTFEEALETMNDLMYTQGKRFDEAIQDMKTAGGAYENLAKNVKGAAAPTRAQFFSALKDVRTEMGSAHVNTKYMTAAMQKFAEAAVRAGASGKTVGETMRLIPKLAQGLPEFFKYQVGREMRAGIETGSEAFKDLPEDIKKQMAAVKRHLSGFQADRASYDILMGTPQGLKRILKSWKGLSKPIQFEQLKNLGLNAQQTISAMEAINSNNEKALDVAAQDITKSKKELEEQDLPSQLRKSAGAMDRVTLAAQDLAKKIEGAKDKYGEWFAAGGTVITGLSALKDAMGTLSAIGAAQGATGTVGSIIAGAKGTAVAALSGTAATIALPAIVAMTVGYLDTKEKIKQVEKAKEDSRSVFRNIAEQTKKQFEQGKITEEKYRAFLKVGKEEAKKTGDTKLIEFMKQQEDAGPRVRAEAPGRVTAPGPAAMGTVATRVTPGTGGSAPTAGGLPPKPAKIDYDPTSKQMTVINLADPQLVAAFSDLMSAQRSMAPKRG